jgi:hypothetical protein
MQTTGDDVVSSVCAVQRQSDHVSCVNLPKALKKLKIILTFVV